MSEKTMTRLLALTLITLIAGLSAASTAAADRPADVQRIERAVLELDRAKRSLTGEIAARQSAVDRELKRCKTGGKAWKRIKKVRNGAQRHSYRNGARLLWSELHRVALDRAALDVEHPIFDRFLGHFSTPVGDPLLQAGIDAHRRHLAYYEAATSFSTCKTFGKLMKSVRNYGTDATGDALAGDVFTKLTSYVRNNEASAVRKYYGSREVRALNAAKQQLIALGGNGGYANYFAFAFSLRV
jgi:hypothetical protein